MIDLCIIQDPQEIEDLVLRENLDLFLQELAVIFNTSSLDIYGHPKVLNLRKWVFAKHVSNYQVQNEIVNYLTENSPTSRKFKYQVTADFISGQLDHDILYIKFDITIPQKGIFSRQFMIS